MEWKRIVRETGLVEWVCKHGVGHPDPVSAAMLDRALGHQHGTWSVHGCDGCCARTAFPGRGLPSRMARNATGLYPVEA